MRAVKRKGCEMRGFARAVTKAVALLVAMLLPPPVFAHGVEMAVGSTVLGSGALAVDFDFVADGRTVATPSVSVGGMTLYTTIFPSFGWVSPDLPSASLFQLPDGTPVSLQMVAVAAGASVQINGVTLSAPGQATLIGNSSSVPGAHVHPSWQLLLPDGASGDFPVTFKLTTTRPPYTESTAYTIIITNVDSVSDTPTLIPSATVTPTVTTSPTPSQVLIPTATHTPTVAPSSTATSTPTPGSTATATSPPTSVDDTVILPVKPISVSIASGQSFVDTLVKVRVVNADAPNAQVPSHPIKLLAQLGDCPPGTIGGAPDFDARTPGAQDTVTLAAGRSKKALVPVHIVSSRFTSFNRVTPTRCTLMLAAITDLAGSLDPNPSNNIVPLEVNVIDHNDPDLAALHESGIDSASPVSVTVGTGQSARSKTSRPRLLYGNLTAVAPVAVALTVSGDCPPGVLGVPTFADGSNIAVVHPGGRTRGRLGVTVHPSDVLSVSTRSPLRCVAVLTATGPSGDTDPSNNSTHLVVDAIDRNDVN